MHLAIQEKKDPINENDLQEIIKCLEQIAARFPPEPEDPDPKLYTLSKFLEDTFCTKR